MTRANRPDEPGAVPAYKRYLDEGKGVPLGSVWDDIGPVQGAADERLGYPTQKPLKLLERSSRSHRSRTTLFSMLFADAAPHWCCAKARTSVDRDRISPTACRVMAKRLRDICRIQEDENYWQRGKGSSSAICRGLRSNYARFRHSSLRIGQSSPSVDPEQSAGRRYGNRWAHISRRLGPQSTQGSRAA